MLNLLERNKGFVVLAVALLIFFVWGINLLSLSMKEQTEVRPGKPVDDGVGMVSMHTLELRPKPFLYYLLEDLKYDVRVTAQEPGQLGRVLVMVEPAGRLPATLMAALMAWVNGGGNLVILTSQPHPLTVNLGADLASGSGLVRPEAPKLEFPWLDEVKSVSTSRSTIEGRPGNSLPWLFRRDTDESTVVTTFRGAGMITMIGGNDFSLPEGLSRADNVVMIVRLIERMAVGGPIFFFDPRPDHALRVRMQRRERRTYTPMVTVKVQKPYLSFWSLLKANPISWVLLQLGLGLVIYLHAVARRFSRPLPVVPPMGSVAGFIDGMARLYQRRGAAGYAAGRLLQQVYGVLRVRLGRAELGGNPQRDLEAVAAWLQESRPGQGDALLRAMRGLTDLYLQQSTNSVALLTWCRQLHAARREVDLTDR